MSRQAPVTATYAHLRHVGTQPDPTPRSEPATPATWANPLGVAMAGFLILAAYLVVMAH
jgi:hypothetical protein